MLEAALERSRVVGVLTSLPDRIGAALEGSRLRELGETIGRYVRASYCYRWLTAEPDPAVIVIDLRETYTVGPIVRLLETAIDELETGYVNSRAARIVAALAVPVRAEPLRLLGVLGLAWVAVSLVGLTLLGVLSKLLFAAHLVAIVPAAAALRSTHSLADLRESRPVTLLARALEPPEPPESRPSTEQTAASMTETATDRTAHLEKRDSSETVTTGDTDGADESDDGRC
ncbi:hypothetical protein A6E15_07135 [Natrinema saccharevitans]|uniref:Uncharacterized protein n=1 Tax=Natrinema saccharevitans TaxID=301967 RepID=A0A1S8AVY8_9EURY|nr:hypothetical protein [Natrinema saccharevitans]OLZ40776.1 hypothetical protein A6E15_07135 [Natrinema saccharevitans]